MKKSLKIKSLIPVILLFAAAGLLGCSKDCEPNLATCNEVPLKGECAAYFERWFYNKQKLKCELVGYSGCSHSGFATKEECEECKCF
jgi:hypothetical protein